MNETIERIVALRHENKLSQTDLANKLGVLSTTLSNYEVGRRIIPLKIVVEIATIFDVTVDYLVGKTDCKANIQTLCRSLESIKSDYNNIANHELYLKLSVLPPKHSEVVNTILDSIMKL